MMVTGSHGVRMQYDYTHDTPGLTGAVSAASPRWLRLTRSGGTLTGYDSADGTHWTKVGTARLTGLPATLQVGLFAASPDYQIGGAGARRGHHWQRVEPWPPAASTMSACRARRAGAGWHGGVGGRQSGRAPGSARRVPAHRRRVSP